MAAACLACWRSQSWSDTELIVVDDADCPAFPEGLAGASITYLRLDLRLTVGAKRNVACERASGEIIVHFDSDDWYAPGRIADQVASLKASGKAVTGYRNIRFTDGETWWLNRNWPGGYGATLCYRRDWWHRHPFPPLREGEDWEFVAAAMRRGEFVARDAGDFMHATIHADNTSARVIGAGWIPCSKPDYIRS